MVRLAGCCLLLLAGVASTLPAQDKPAPQDTSAYCRACMTHGKIPCSKHGKMLEKEQEPNVVNCSVAAECKACGGALAVDCKQCVDTKVEAELARRQELVRDWLQKRRQTIDALTGREPYAHLQTTHYDLAMTLKPATVGKDKIDQHQRLHLYGERLEALRDLFLATFELPDAELPDRMTVLMSEDAKDHGVLGPRLTGMGTANSVGLKLMGPEYVYSMWADKRSMPDDEAVHRNIVHNVSHLLLTQMKPPLFLGNHGNGWIDEGVAHWLEDKAVGKCTNFCFEEVLLQSPASFKGGKWRPAVRRFVDDGKAIEFATLAQKNTDQLNYVEHTFAFAFVDFLIAKFGGAKFRDLVRLAKAQKPMREALQQVYGLNPLTIDAPFQAWVKETYSPLLER
jgi:hypothetical protein